MSDEYALRTARAELEGLEAPTKPADKIATAHAWATLAVAEETARVADNLADVEQRIERAADAVLRGAR